LAPIAFAYGYRQAKAPFDFDPFVMTVLIGMAMGPAAFVWFAAYSIQQGRKLSVETQRAKAFTDQMIGPSLAAGIDAGQIVASSARGNRRRRRRGRHGPEVHPGHAPDRGAGSDSPGAVHRRRRAGGRKPGPDPWISSAMKWPAWPRPWMVRFARSPRPSAQNAADLARVSEEADAQMKAAESLLGDADGRAFHRYASSPPRRPGRPERT